MLMSADKNTPSSISPEFLKSCGCHTSAHDTVKSSTSEEILKLLIARKKINQIMSRFFIRYSV